MKKVKYIALVLVLMLGLIGAGYAYWEDTLTVSGSVETADFNVRFANIEEQNGERVLFAAGEYDDYNDWEYPLDEGERGGATGNVFLDADDDYKSMTFTVENAWPWLTAYTFVDVVNESEIPVKLEGITITDNDGGVEHQDEGAAYGIHDGAMHINIMKVNEDYEYFEVGDVIEAGEEEQVCVAAYLNDGEVVDPDEEYTFTIEMEWVQFNKPEN